MGSDKIGSDSIEILWRVPDWFPELQSKTLDRLAEFHNLLLKFNKTINLISVKSIPNCDLVHFSDCIVASKIIYKRIGDNEVFDIGAGNGFPGIVLGILFPKMKVIMVDSDQRKCEFLKHCVTSLGLTNCSVLCKRAEDLADDSIHYAVSRGFAPIAKSILISRRFVKLGGVYFHLKSEEWASEVGNIPIQLCSFWKPELVEEYKLPLGSVKYSIIKTEKIKD